MDRRGTVNKQLDVGIIGMGVVMSFASRKM
jgi:hypothetical protein